MKPRIITDRQAEVLNFIIGYTEKYSFAPSTREIAEHFQITVNAIQDHISALKRKGYVKSDGRKPRTLVVLKAA